MSPEELKDRIQKAIEAVEAMDDETIKSAMDAGLLDRRFKRGNSE